GSARAKARPIGREKWSGEYSRPPFPRPVFSARLDQARDLPHFAALLRRSLNEQEVTRCPSAVHPGFRLIQWELSIHIVGRVARATTQCFRSAEWTWQREPNLVGCYSNRVETGRLLHFSPNTSLPARWYRSALEVSQQRPIARYHAALERIDLALARHILARVGVLVQWGDNHPVPFRSSFSREEMKNQPFAYSRRTSVAAVCHSSNCISQEVRPFCGRSAACDCACDESVESLFLIRSEALSGHEDEMR